MAKIRPIDERIAEIEEKQRRKRERKDPAANTNRSNI